MRGKGDRDNWRHRFWAEEKGWVHKRKGERERPENGGSTERFKRQNKTEGGRRRVRKVKGWRPGKKGRASRLRGFLGGKESNGKKKKRVIQK